MEKKSNAYEAILIICVAAIMIFFFIKVVFL